MRSRLTVLVINKHGKDLSKFTRANDAWHLIWNIFDNCKQISSMYCFIQEITSAQQYNPDICTHHTSPIRSHTSAQNGCCHDRCMSHSNSSVTHGKVYCATDWSDSRTTHKAKIHHHMTVTCVNAIKCQVLIDDDVSFTGSSHFSRSGLGARLVV